MLASGLLIQCYLYVILFQVIVMTKANPQKAKKHLEKVRELISKRKHPFSDMTEDEIIEALRKTRKELWGKKLAARS